MLPTVSSATNEQGVPANGTTNANSTSAPPSSQDPGFFQCGSCKRTYTRLDHLARHVRSHTQDKPYQCDICSKRFARIDLLKRHVAGHESRPGERNNKRLKVQPPANGASRVTQACEACAGMHLKCEEKKPCTRCVKKNIACRFENVAHSESDGPMSSDRPPLAVQEIPAQVQEKQPSPAASNGIGFDAAMTTNGIHDYANGQLAPSQSNMGYANGDAFQHQADAAVLSDYLNNVLPNFSDPFVSIFSNGFGTGTFTPRGFSDFGFESNIELNDIDLTFLDSYNTEIPFYYGGSPNNVFPASTPGESSNSSSEPYRSAAIGAEAYQKSYWKFKPKRLQSGYVEEHNLSLPADNGDQGSPESRITLPRRIIAEKLNTRTRDRILAVIVGSCKKENLSRALTSFPSVDLLDILVQFYLSSPIVRPDAHIHVPTLDLSTARPEFLAAMISCGAVLTSDPALTKLGLAIQECVRMAVPEIWENDNSLIRDLEFARAYLIQLEVGLWSGNSRKIEIAESFLQPLLTMMRRDNKLRRSSYPPIIVNPEDEGEALKQKWKAWANQESHKRLMYRILHHDRVASMSLLVPPIINYAELLLPLPDAREVWMAPTAEKWKEAYLSKLRLSAERRPSLVDCLMDLENLHSHQPVIDEYEANLAFIAGAWGLVWEYSQFNSLHKTQSRHWNALVMQSRYDELVKLLQHFRIGLDMKSRHANETVMRLELVMMHLHMSLEDVQLFAGIEGPEEARRVFPSLLEWVKSSSARQTVWHAGQVIRAAKAMPKGWIRGFPVIAVYHASLAFWVYGLLSEGPNQMNGSIPEHTRLIPIWLDEVETNDVQRFIQFERGSPGIRGLPKTDVSAIQGALLDNPSKVMETVLEILRKNFEGANTPLLVENVIQLMSGLQSAAARRGTS